MEYLPKEEQEVILTVNRKEFEKIVILMNHTTRPFMDFCFDPEQKRKVRVTLDYDPDETCVEIKYHAEDKV